MDTMMPSHRDSTVAARTQTSHSPNWRFCIPLLIAAKQEFPPIPRAHSFTESGQNPDNSRWSRTVAYADRGDILNAINPVLWKHGFDLHQDIEESGGGLHHTLVSTLWHSSGEWLRSHLPLPARLRNGDLQDASGVLTRAYRYGLTPLLGIITEETTRSGTDVGMAPAPAAAAPPRATEPSPVPGVRTRTPEAAAGQVPGPRARRAAARSQPPEATAAAPAPEAAPGGNPQPAEPPPPLAGETTAPAAPAEASVEAPQVAAAPAEAPADATAPSPFADMAKRIAETRDLTQTIVNMGNAGLVEVARKRWLQAADLLKACPPREVELLFDTYVAQVGEAPPAIEGVTYPEMPEG